MRLARVRLGRGAVGAHLRLCRLGLFLPENPSGKSVPASRGSAVDGYIPYEGDEILSLVISKAMMLADDEHIEDKSIVRQIEFQR